MAEVSKSEGPDTSSAGGFNIARAQQVSSQLGLDQPGSNNPGIVASVRREVFGFNPFDVEHLSGAKREGEK